MKKLLLLLLLPILLLSCGSLKEYDEHYNCEYFISKKVVNDTVYIKSTHIHLIYDCDEKQPLNNDWIIMH